MPAMQSQQSREDTYIRNIIHIRALMDYVRRCVLDTLNTHMKDEVQGLTGRQCITIAIVQLMTSQSSEGVTLSNLARELHMSISAASHLVDTLVERQLLVRSTNEDNRRSIFITLSPTGQQCATTARNGMLRTVTALTSRLTPEEEDLRLHIIDKLYKLVYPDEG